MRVCQRLSNLEAARCTPDFSLPLLQICGCVFVPFGVQFCVHFGSILSPWGCPETPLESSWAPFFRTCAPRPSKTRFWAHFGLLLGPLLGPSWRPFSTLGTLRGSPGVSQEGFWSLFVGLSVAASIWDPKKHQKSTFSEVAEVYKT